MTEIIGNDVSCLAKKMQSTMEHDQEGARQGRIESSQKFVRQEDELGVSIVISLHAYIGQFSTGDITT